MKPDTLIKALWCVKHPSVPIVLDTSTALGLSHDRIGGFLVNLADTLLIHSDDPDDNVLHQLLFHQTFYTDIQQSPHLAGAYFALADQLADVARYMVTRTPPHAVEYSYMHCDTNPGLIFVKVNRMSNHEYATGARCQTSTFQNGCD